MVTTFGYARVSTRDQNVNRQLDALRAFPVAEENIYVDRFTGATFERPEWQRMVGNLACGDLLVVASIDRLGRSYADILDQWRHLTRDIGADITVLDMPLLDTRPARGAVPGVTGALISDIVLQLLSYVAQVEREGIRRRQAEGIAAAKARGARFGRPAKPRPPCYPDERAQFERGEVSSARAARACGVCRSTFWKWVRADRLKEALGEQDACLRLPLVARRPLSGGSILKRRRAVRPVGRHRAPRGMPQYACTRLARGEGKDAAWQIRRLPRSLAERFRRRLTHRARSS